MGGKKKSSYLRRVEKITERLGIEDEKIADTELHQQGQLKMLWKRIHKHWNKWYEFDKKKRLDSAKDWR